MTVPSREKQIAAVSRYLDSEHTEGKSLEEVASRIVDYFLKTMVSEVKHPALVPHVGAAFKHPAMSGVWFVAHAGEKLWIVSASSRYGSFISADSPFWNWAEASKAKAGAPGNNSKWMVGDKVSRNQRQFMYEVVATGDKCVLLSPVSHEASLQAEPNDNMDTYYRRESRKKELDW